MGGIRALDRDGPYIFPRWEKGFNKMTAREIPEYIATAMYLARQDLERRGAKNPDRWLRKYDGRKFGDTAWVNLIYWVPGMAPSCEVRLDLSHEVSLSSMRKSWRCARLFFPEGIPVFRPNEIPSGLSEEELSRILIIEERFNV